MTLTEIKKTLQDLNLRPSRRLGQNYLHDQNLARVIVDLAGIEPTDQVVEIGPGLGALTKILIARTGRLQAVEKDVRAAEFLRSRFPGLPVHTADALEHEFPAAGPWIAIGNLPYSVASRLIVHLCGLPNPPRRMLFTIQREVADRLAAPPNVKDYGVLTLLVRPGYSVNVVRRLPTSVFHPEPEVESAVVLLESRSCPLDAAARVTYEAMVKRAFQQRRKTLGAIFGKTLPAGLDPRKRPAEISLEQWISAARGEDVFDVVDECDRVVGRERRAIVHATGLRHRAVHVLIFNKKGDLFLQQRSLSKDVSPGCWDSSACGHVDAGEDYETAAVRELDEELGLRGANPKDLEFLFKLEACEQTGQEFVKVYRLQHEGPFDLHPEEIQAGSWMHPAEVAKLIAENPMAVAASFRYLWNEYLKRG